MLYLSGAVAVIVCSSIIVFCKGTTSLEYRLIDPMMALVSIGFLLFLSYPYSEFSTFFSYSSDFNRFSAFSVKEAASVLLQTIPDSIDIHHFQRELVEKFPVIQSIHDLHIWQLTQQKFVSTVHIIFLDPISYKAIINDVIAFFHEQGINIVTIQPEFKNLSEETEAVNEELKPLVEGPVRDLCLVACRETSCDEKLCCKRNSSGESDESLNMKTKSSAQLEQVISISNLSAEDLNQISNFTSAKSLDFDESADSSQVEISKIRSSASLHNPSTIHSKHHKLQKAISAIDREHQHVPSASTSEDINLVSIKKFVSESVIKTGEHDHLRRQSSDILVENRMMKQLDTTDNNEMEDLYSKCDREK